MNNDYGIYPENGDDIVMEAVDRNDEYEQQVTATTGDSDNENEYDKMYEDQADNQENAYDKMYD